MRNYWLERRKENVKEIHISLLDVKEWLDRAERYLEFRKEHPEYYPVSEEK